jgi:hypothetical protein
MKNVITSLMPNRLSTKMLSELMANAGSAERIKAFSPSPGSIQM